MITSSIVFATSVYIISILVVYMKKERKRKNKLKDNDYLIEFK